MRPPFPLEVPGVGSFTFRRRTLADDLAIQAHYDRLCGGVTSPSSYLDTMATALATYRVLAASWPGQTKAAGDPWAPAMVEQMDLLDDDRTGQLLKVYGALSAREDEFRPPAKRRGAAPGESPGEQPGDLVPPPVSAGTDGPAVSGGDAG
jgi:hypothetical protein